ncbi:MAG: family 10 glycosylhydrolase [Oscillospiraceae bacterium]|nr:family 10 glycosylhydrolase [Oscillospiraceae bacterium]MDD4413034.1 family 10 glycosylhydrolase [Oscillospiraceae bacterium]
MRYIKTIFTLFIISFLLTSCLPRSYWLLSNDEPTTAAQDTTTGSVPSSSESSSDIPEESLTTTEFGTDTSAGSSTSLSPSSSTTTKKPTTNPTTKKPTTTTAKKPDTDKEFLGVWVSYIELAGMLNGKTVAQAKAQIDQIMTNSKAYGLNAVIFHVRSHSNAYYKSKIFKAAAAAKPLIDAGFDPLEYAVQAAHSRGLELHAWINPYRIGGNLSYAIGKDYFKSGSNYYYNPSSSAAQKLIIDGVGEIVNNYDVDGVQFDDYFYPNDPAVIPKDKAAAFEKNAFDEYKSKGGKLGIADWRRFQVSVLISAVYSKVHTREDCDFGISPGGIQSNNYNNLYADVALWMRQAKYIDYICPQIYYGFLNKSSAFDKNLDGWIAMQRSPSVKLYVGLALYKIGIADDEWAGDDGRTEWADHDDIIKRQLVYTRSKSECGGVMFFSYSFFKPSSGNAVATREIENLLGIL